MEEGEEHKIVGRTDSSNRNFVVFLVVLSSSSSLLSTGSWPARLTLVTEHAHT